MKLTLRQILAGSTSGHTCCRRELASHWPHTAHTAAVDSHRPGSTVPTDCIQPKWHQQREKSPTRRYLYVQSGTNNITNTATKGLTEILHFKRENVLCTLEWYILVFCSFQSANISCDL